MRFGVGLSAALAMMTIAGVGDIERGGHPRSANAYGASKKAKAKKPRRYKGSKAAKRAVRRKA